MEDKLHILPAASETSFCHSRSGYYSNLGNGPPGLSDSLCSYPFQVFTSVNETASFQGESSHHSPFTYKGRVSLNVNAQTRFLNPYFGWQAISQHKGIIYIFLVSHLWKHSYIKLFTCHAPEMFNSIVLCCWACRSLMGYKLTSKMTTYQTTLIRPQSFDQTSHFSNKKHTSNP